MYTRMRDAIAMIELIFAIVILGVVMMSAPTLISTASKSSFVALQQESIATVAAEIGMVLTHHWDEEDANETRSAPILATAGDGDLNETNASGTLFTGRRAGTPASSKRSFLDSMGERHSATASSDLGSDGGDQDDIDDFITTGAGGGSGLSQAETTGSKDADIVDKDIVITTKVAYISDIPTSGSYLGSTTTLKLNDPLNTPAPNDTSNIKHIEVRLTTNSQESELEKNIVMHAFSCNIGTYELNSRSF